MSKKNIYLDLHVLQTVPPSCINRDDTGSPKTAVYGGVQRARVSSQAWKHAMRKKFSEIFDAEQVGIRTRSAVAVISEGLIKLGYDGDADKAAVEGLKKAKIKISKENKTDALFFISRIQARNVAELIISGNTNETDYKNALASSPSIDMALFGRMVALDKGDQALNYDAAAQVAHSISTHEVRTEYDYYTAVDDYTAEDTTSAGFVGTSEFNSSTLYRYATVNVRDLANYLENDTVQAVRGFIRSFLMSMPTGKQNSFANGTVPDFAYITIRTDQPVNLVGAFEKPIATKNDGYTDKSVEALKIHAIKTYGTFVGKPEKAYCVGVNAEELGNNVSLNELLEKIGTDIDAYLLEE